jgi:2-polyprenyl-3-methyl-5-hydroxy-6-metoxy-1,4-benzoquinol methylase
MDIKEYRQQENKTRHPWETARLEVMLQLVEKHLNLNQKLQIADIGCGDTFIVDSMSQRYKQASFLAVDTAFTADDMENFAQNHASKKIQLIQNHREIAAKSIDLVLLMDVIEHIEYEADFLHELVNQSYITDNTLFFISVPAFQSSFTTHDEFLNHYRRYNQKQLKKVLQENGYQLVESGYFFFSLLKVRFLEKMRELIFGKREMTGLVNNPFSEKRAAQIKKLLLLDFKITQALRQIHLGMPGLSTYALCRKSV